MAATLTVEIMENGECENGDSADSPGKPSAGTSAQMNRSSSSPEHLADATSPRLQRQRTLAAVQAHGGHVAGARLTRREQCRRMLNSIWWISGQLAACLCDLGMLIAEINDASLTLVDTVTFFVLLTFCADLGLRWYTYRRMLLRSCWAWFDFTIVGLSVILYLAGLAAGIEGSTTSSRTVGTGLRGLVVTLRWVRAVRAAAMLLKTGSASRSAARQLTGENKRRYVDLQQGFDLDLVYIRPRLVAMSVPSTGLTALYRNPLSEVSRFFESRHCAEGYLIVNCCPEMPYPTSSFRCERACPRCLSGVCW